MPDFTIPNIDVNKVTAIPNMNTGNVQVPNTNIPTPKPVTPVVPTTPVKPVTPTPTAPVTTPTPVVPTTPAGLTPNPAVKDAVMKTITESPNLITALESIGPDYGIPATNMMVDNSLKSIKCVGENILAPENLSAKKNTKAIMCSIGVVLDYISQRIDNELNDFQMKAIADDKTLEPQQTMIPLDDTGHQSYFMDEDADISKGIFKDTSVITKMESVDISETIHEQSYFIDAINKLGGTLTLGHDLLKAQGFDYVKPYVIVQESADVSPSNNKKQISPSDIKHMKFDNKNILKAIKFFNAAYAEQIPEKARLDIKQFIDSPNYQKGIDALNDQFNCRIIVRFFKDSDSDNNFATQIYNDIKNNVSISKSKGFQLGGLPINMIVVNKAMTEDAPKDPELFGQSLVSIMLHELFHNITAVWKLEDTEFATSLITTINIARGIDNAKQKRLMLSNYVNTLDNFGNIKMNILTKRKLVKQLALLSTISDDEKSLIEFQKTLSEAKSNNVSDAEIDKMIKLYETRVNEMKANRTKSLKRKNYTSVVLMAAVSVIGLMVTPLLPAAYVGMSTMAFISSLSIAGMSTLTRMLHNFMAVYIQDEINKYDSIKEYEEFYCDMFAGMYNLPITFLVGMPGKRTYTPNEIAPDKVKKINDLERELRQMLFSTYPTTGERNYASLKIAKKVLEEDDNINPAIKKYLEWIVANYSSMEESNIEEIYNQTTFDPKTAEDLDTHIQNLINKNNVTLTESDVSWLKNDKTVMSDLYMG